MAHKKAVPKNTSGTTEFMLGEKMHTPASVFSKQNTGGTTGFMLSGNTSPQSPEPIDPQSVVRKDPFNLIEFLKVRQTRLRKLTDTLDQRIDAYNNKLHSYMDSCQDSPLIREEIKQQEKELKEEMYTLIAEKHALCSLTDEEQTELLKRADASQASGFGGLPTQPFYPDELTEIDTVFPERDLDGISESKYNPLTDLQHLSGLSPQTLINYAEGNTHPDRNILLRLAFILKLPPTAAYVLLLSCSVNPLTQDSPRDIVIMDALKRGFSLEQAEAALASRNEKFRHKEILMDWLTREIFRHDTEIQIAENDYSDCARLTDELEKKCAAFKNKPHSAMKKPATANIENDVQPEKETLGQLQDQLNASQKKTIKQKHLLDNKKAEQEKDLKKKIRAALKESQLKDEAVSADKKIYNSIKDCEDEITAMKNEPEKIKEFCLQQLVICEKELQAMRKEENLRKTVSRFERDFAPLNPDRGSLSAELRQAMKDKNLTLEELLSMGGLKNVSRCLKSNRQEKAAVKCKDPHAKEASSGITLEALDQLQKEGGLDVIQRDELLILCFLLGLKKEAAQKILGIAQYRRLHSETDRRDKRIALGLSMGYSLETMNNRLADEKLDCLTPRA